MVMRAHPQTLLFVAILQISLAQIMIVYRLLDKPFALSLIIW